MAPLLAAIEAPENSFLIPSVRKDAVHEAGILQTELYE